MLRRWLQGRIETVERRKLRASLKKRIDLVFKEEMERAKKTGEPWDVTQDRICDLIASDEDQLLNLRQLPVVEKLVASPLEVPPVYWKEDRHLKQSVPPDEDVLVELTLTDKGEKWARHELKKLKRADIEFWAKLVLPVISIVLSIIALVISSHRH